MRITSPLWALAVLLSPLAGAAEDGGALYKDHCAVCHESGVSRAAPSSVIGKLPASDIRLALTQGSMQTQGAQLSAAEREAVTLFLVTGAAPAPPSEASQGQCAAAGKPYSA